MSLQAVLVSALCASTALAHFKLDYPEGRGFQAAIEPQFCGGFNSTMAERQPVPLENAPIWIASHHPIATVDAFISTKADPKSFDDFNATINGTSSIAMVTDFFQVKQGEACWTIDFSKLPYDLKNGSEITLQIQYNGGDGALYQCTDLVLVSNYSVPSNYTCSNDAAANFSATHSGAISATGAGPSSPAGSKGSDSKGSGSGALPTVACSTVLALVAAGFYALM